MSDNSGANGGAQPVMADVPANPPPVPPFVGQYHDPRDQPLPPIVTFDINTNQSKIEKSLCNFFKCTKSLGPADESSDEESDAQSVVKCFATRNTALQFDCHLKSRHPEVELKCVYCLQQNQPIKCYSHRYLIKHMLNRHAFRRYQCSVCLYRAITEDHLYVHQRTHHSVAFGDVSSVKNRLKIFLCHMTDITGPTDHNQNQGLWRSVHYYYSKHRAIRLNSEGNNETLYQCLYCEVMAERLQEVVEHCVQRHPDYPILYYIPEPMVSSSTASESVNPIIRFDNPLDTSATIRPKLEPQDNDVSSTQRTPPLNDTDCRVNNEMNRRRSLEDSDQSTSRQPKQLCANGTVGSDASDNNGAQSVSHDLTTDYANSVRICMFFKCKQTFSDCESAKTHIQEKHVVTTHLGEQMRQLVVHWMQWSFLKQIQLCSFEAIDYSGKCKAFYSCPLCVKLAKINQRVAKRYKTYEEVRSHLWQHCCWLPIKCRMCKQYLPDAAPFIAKHFIDEHFLHIKQQKYNFVTLYEPNMSFSNEEFVILQKKLIEVNTNPDIEANIRRLLEASEDGYYSRLRKKCHKKVLSVDMFRLTPEQIAEHLEKTDETEDTDRPPEQLAAIEPQRSDASDRISALKNSKDKTNADNNSRDKSSSSSDDRDKSSSSSGKRRGRLPKESSTERALRSDSNSCDKRGDKTDVLLDTINRLKESCRSSGDGNGPNDAMASTSARNNDTLGADNVDMDEDDYRVACYHCNDKFKSKKEFNAHSQKKHPHKSARWYAKQLK